MIGQQFNSAAIKEDIESWPFKVVPEEGSNQPLIQVTCDGVTKSFRVEEISGFLLSEMRRRASEVIGHDVNEAVITVPAHFNHS